MSSTTSSEALTRRKQLLTDGYTVVPQVFEQPVLEYFKRWTTRYFAKHGSDPRFRYQGSDIKVYSPACWATGMPRRTLLARADGPSHLKRIFPDAMATQFVTSASLRTACDALGLQPMTSDMGMVTVLSKPGHGPPLYWHQDFMDWNHPIATTPWPTRIFLGIYLTDTSIERGCLRIIPGTHRKRIDLHDLLPDAHEKEIKETALNTPAFMERSDAVDLPMRAGDLVVCDARTLHGAHANASGERRTMLLAWHDVFPFPDPPSWWKGPIPDIVRHAPRLERSERFKQRRPGVYLT